MSEAGGQGHPDRLLATVEEGRRATVASLIGQLALLPDDLWPDVQMFQPDTGCMNRCTFCSQHAGTEVVRVGSEGIVNFVTALQVHLSTLYPDRAAASEPLLGFDRKHKPGVIYPYQDNDTGGSLYLDVFAEETSSRLGTRVRLSTVGIPRKNPRMVEAHTRLATELADTVDGVRFSFTPYAIGWARGEADDTSRTEYVEDFAHSLRIYRPFIEARGVGKDIAAVDLRFAPNLTTSHEQVREEVISIGDRRFRMISLDNLAIICEAEDPLETANLVAIKAKRPVYDKAGVAALVIQADGLKDPDFSATALIEAVLQSQHDAPLSDTPTLRSFDGTECIVRKGELFVLENVDGKYYCVDPAKRDDGSYNAVQLYPKTETRHVSGVLNSTRYLLNTLVAYRKERGIEDPATPFTDAAWEDVANVLGLLKEHISQYRSANRGLADYIENEVFPQAAAYATALEKSGLPAHLFFNLQFTRDTGIIVNQGRAHHLFRGIISRSDTPLTANEAKSDFPHDQEPDPVRVYPAPYLPRAAQTGRRGGKNEVAPQGTMIITRVGSAGFTPLGATHHVHGVDMTTSTLASASELPLFPGARSRAV